MLTQEIVCGISKNNKGGNVVLKLDMTKAFDRFRGLFLLKLFIDLVLMTHGLMINLI